MKCREGIEKMGGIFLKQLKGELQEETGAIKFEIKPICVYSVTSKTRSKMIPVEETFGLLCFAEITEFGERIT